MTRLLSSLAALAALCCASWAAPTAVAVESPGVVIVRGNKMFNVKTGERFIMKGVRFLIQFYFKCEDERTWLMSIVDFWCS